MGSRETLEDLVEHMSDDEIVSLLARLRDRAPAAKGTVLDLSQSPRLADVWDNDEDAIYDELDARIISEWPGSTAGEARK